MPTGPNVTKSLDHIVTRLRTQPPMRRITMAQDIYAQLTEMQATVAAERRAAVRELREQGRTLSEIARLLGVSISRVKQMEDGPNKTKPTAEQKVATLKRQLDRAQTEAEAS